MSWAWVIGLLAGLVTGVISGFGIGGGSLLILYLTTFAGMINTPPRAQSPVFPICAPAALISHIKNKLVDWKTVLFCTVTGVVTSVGAAFAAAAIDVSLLRRLFGVLLLYIGVKELFCKSPKKEKEGERKSSETSTGQNS